MRASRHGGMPEWSVFQKITYQTFRGKIRRDCFPSWKGEFTDILTVSDAETFRKIRM